MKKKVSLIINNSLPCLSSLIINSSHSIKNLYVFFISSDGLTSNVRTRLEQYDLYRVPNAQTMDVPPP